MSSFSDFLSFLSNGQPPINAPSTGQTNTELPPWYNDYTQSILAKGAQWGAEPYTPYTGPRVAPVNETYGQAKDVLSGIGEGSAQYYGAAAGLINQGTSGSALTAANPYFAKASGMTPSADYGASNAMATAGGNAPGGLPMAKPLIDRATSQSALTNAQPFVKNAAGEWPDEFQKYMSPYTSQVTDEMARLSNRDLTEKFLPALNDTFIRSGGTRGGMNSNLDTSAVRLGRDVMQDLGGRQASALEAGYKTSADIFGSDQNRQTQLAQIVGNLTASDMDALIKSGATLGDLAERAAGRQISAAGVLGSNATGAGNIALGAQRNMVDMGQAAGALSSQDLTRAIQGGSAMGDMGTNWARTGVDVSRGLSDVAKVYQDNTQANLNTAYSDFTTQRDWPLTQAKAQQDLLTGMKIPEATTTYDYKPADAYGASPLSQMAQMAMLWGAMTDKGGGGGGGGGTDWSKIFTDNFDWGSIFGPKTTGGG